MTNPLQPGARGERLPAGENVLRLIRPSNDGTISEAAFILSEEDQTSALQAISVFAERLTSPKEALAFIKVEKQQEYRLYAVLSVDEIRTLRPEPDSPAVPYLDVVWDPLHDEVTGFPDTRPGSIGHAGITGLMRPQGLAQAKLMYKSLRLKLTDMANAHLRTLSSDTAP